MSEFITVAKVQEIPPGQSKSFKIGARLITVFHVGERFYAMDDYCPHMGASLADGAVTADTVTCRQHLWTFRFSDGGCSDCPTLQAETFEVRIAGDEVQIGIRG